MNPKPSINRLPSQSALGQLEFITYETPEEAKKPSIKRAVKVRAARHHWARDAALRASKSKRAHGGTQASRLVVRNRIHPSTSTELLDHGHPDQSQLGLIGPLGAGRVDPFRTYPVMWQPYLPKLVDHYIGNIAVRVAKMDKPRGDIQLRTRWFTLAMTDPATFSSVLLLSISHLHKVQANPNVTVTKLQLKEQAIRTINEALTDPSRNYSDAVIGAVLKICCYEAIFDSADAFMIHMKGLQTMIAARGGLSALGVNGLLRRICLWIDMRSAAQNKTPLFFKDDIPKGVTGVKPIPE